MFFHSFVVNVYQKVYPLITGSTHMGHASVEGSTSVIKFKGMQFWCSSWNPLFTLHPSIHPRTSVLRLSSTLPKDDPGGKTPELHIPTVQYMKGLWQSISTSGSRTYYIQGGPSFKTTHRKTYLKPPTVMKLSCIGTYLWTSHTFFLTRWKLTLWAE